jgi:P-type Ca2+ transporter type 2C
VGELPFESARAFAATFYAVDDVGHVAVKGALERLLPRCTAMHTADGVVPLDAAAVTTQAEAMASQGQRFIAVAEGTFEGPLRGALSEDHLPSLTLLGLIGLIDPPRPEARDAVAQCLAAGVEVAMVTGDHPRTAFAIAQQLGIAQSDDQVVTGQQLRRRGRGRRRLRRTWPVGVSSRGLHRCRSCTSSTRCAPPGTLSRSPVTG